MERQTFKLNDMVEWTSQSSGRTLKKTGRIEQILGPHEKPKSDYRLGNDSLPRGHTSYVVHVFGRGYYWPLVKYLRLAGTGPCPHCGGTGQVKS